MSRGFLLHSPPPIAFLRMPMTPFARALALVALLVPFAATAQKFEPQVGQAGKDVIWVPTPEEVVERMLTMAQVGPNDFVMDLRSEEHTSELQSHVNLVCRL